MTDHPMKSEQAETFLRQWRQDRAKAAQYAVDHRALWSDMEMTTKQRLWLNNDTRKMLRAKLGPTYSQRPTATVAHRLSRQYRDAARNARGRFGEHGTEYYSACGHDDYLSEMIAETEHEALLLRASAIMMATERVGDEF